MKRKAPAPPNPGEQKRQPMWSKQHELDILISVTTTIDDEKTLCTFLDGFFGLGTTITPEHASHVLDALLVRGLFQAVGVLLDNHYTSYGLVWKQSIRYFLARDTTYQEGYLQLLCKLEPSFVVESGILLEAYTCFSAIQKLIPSICLLQVQAGSPAISHMSTVHQRATQGLTQLLQILIQLDVRPHLVRRDRTQSWTWLQQILTRPTIPYSTFPLLQQLGLFNTINHVTPNGRTALSLVLQKSFPRSRKIGIVKQMLDHKADPNLGDPAKSSWPLWLAANQNNPSLLELLVQAGADVHTPMKEASWLAYIQQHPGVRPETKQWLAQFQSHDEPPPLES